MIKLETISIELKNINRDVESYQLKELIEKIDQEIKEKNACYKPSDKKRLDAIKRYLKSIPKYRPALQCWTPLKSGGVGFTDSYSLIILDRKTLPFKVAFSNEFTEEDQEEFIKNNNIDKSDVFSGVYPNLENLIPDENNKLDTFIINVDDFLSFYKVNDKKNMKNGLIVYNLSDKKEIIYNVNPTYLKAIIDILMLTGDITIEFYGDYKPAIIRKNKEIGLLLPIRTY